MGTIVGTQSDISLAVYSRQPVSVRRGIPIFSQPTAVSQNYDQIARDHLAAARDGVSNPFMEEDLWKRLEHSTLDLLNKYCKEGGKVLDVGVGLGRLLDQVKNRERFGADLTFEYLEIAKSRGIEVCCASADDLPYKDAFFDAVVCTDVLEHVFDLNATIRSMLRVLKNNGVLIVRVPDREDLSPYLAPAYPYRFAHLRNFDEPGLHLLLSRVFNCEFVESCPVVACYDVKIKLPLPSVGKYLVTQSVKRSLFWNKIWFEWVVQKLYRPVEINIVFRKLESNEISNSLSN